MSKIRYHIQAKYYNLKQLQKSFKNYQHLIFVTTINIFATINTLFKIQLQQEYIFFSVGLVITTSVDSQSKPFLIVKVKLVFH